MDKKIIHVIIPAKDEESFLPNCLESLKRQTYPPEKIIVIDDGSIDRTAEIARKYGAIVISLKSSRERSVGLPRLAKVLNVGFNYLKKQKNDYIMVVGAKQVFPKDYIEKLLKKMERDPKLVIASGYIKGETYNPLSPRGGGRLIKRDFFEKIGFKYPPVFGWESYIIFKALVMGYKTRCFKNIIAYNQRPTSMSKRKCYFLGLGMNALGYWWLYVLGRFLLTFIKKPSCGVLMISGYLKSVKKTDIADKVSNLQKRRFTYFLKGITKRIRYYLK